MGNIAYQIAVLPSSNSLQGHSQLALLTVCFNFIV